jgi:hypothetical protein
MAVMTFREEKVRTDALSSRARGGVSVRINGYKISVGTREKKETTCPNSKRGVVRVFSVM